MNIRKQHFPNCFPSLLIRLLLHIYSAQLQLVNGKFVFSVMKVADTAHPILLDNRRIAL